MNPNVCPGCRLKWGRCRTCQRTPLILGSEDLRDCRPSCYAASRRLHQQLTIVARRLFSIQSRTSRLTNGIAALRSELLGLLPQFGAFSVAWRSLARSAADRAIASLDRDHPIRCGDRFPEEYKLAACRISRRSVSGSHFTTA
jgi:hypothetical protein